MEKSVDLMAPGLDVFTLFPENRTFVAEGTSISAPMVSGVAALIWSYFPTLSAQEVKNVILESVDYYGEIEVIKPSTTRELILFKEFSKTGGVLNAYNSVLNVIKKQ